MQLLDLTLPTPAENLALDEALLDEADATGRLAQVLRLWEPDRPMVVIGRSSKIAEEVDLAECRRRGVAVLRRASGGTAVVTGPGCLMYALVLGLARYPALRMVDQAHRFVLGRIAQALAPLVDDVALRGTSDLAAGALKFSGNSIRVKRNHLLYHGTLLYDFPLELIGACLRRPPRQPDYRRGRPHGEFVTNLPLDRGTLRQALIAAFHAVRPVADWPRRRTARLVDRRYGRDAWHHER